MRATKLRVGLAVAILITILGGTTAYASHDFGDVPDTNGFHNNIDWMKQRQITFGCNTAGTLYCPQANVTRGQMAAFMERLARTLSPRAISVTNPSGNAGDILVAGTTPVVCQTGDYAVENWAETFHITGDMTGLYLSGADFAVATNLVVSEDSGATWQDLNVLTLDFAGGTSPVGTTSSSATITSNDGFGGTAVRFGIQSSSGNANDAIYLCNLSVVIEHRYSNPIAGVTGGASEGSAFNFPDIGEGSPLD